MFAGLQYRLWVADGGLAHTHRLANEARAQREQIAQFAARNAALDAEIADLKSGVAAIESRARMTLGMVHDGETFFLVVDPS
ncbi:MAG: septum formation initiator family protein [Nevskiaceae bacterium]